MDWSTVVAPLAFHPDMNPEWLFQLAQNAPTTGQDEIDEEIRAAQDEIYGFAADFATIRGLPEAVK